MNKVIAWVVSVAKRTFTRPVRASLYASGLAAVLALIAAHQIPGWTAPIAGPFLLALLNLKPSDVDQDEP